MSSSQRRALRRKFQTTDVDPSLETFRRRFEEKLIIAWAKCLAHQCSTNI